MTRAVHDTFVIEKSYRSSPSAVFAAFAERSIKARWYAEGGAHDPVSFDSDFRVGGQEVLVGRMKPGTPVAGAILTWSQVFHRIEADRQIVFAQTLDFGDVRISSALITVELEPSDGGCRLTLTHQAAYFEGADGPEMRKFGWQSLLEALGGALEAAA